MAAITGLVGGCSSSKSTPETDPGQQSGGDLEVIGPALVQVSGPEGGPFSDGTQDYEVVNLREGPLNWEAVASSSWLEVDPAGGFLGAGARTSATISIDQAVAAGLPVGSYSAQVVFSEAGSSGDEIIVTYTLTVTGQLIVTPETDFQVRGTTDGELDQDTVAYVLTNTRSSVLDWASFASVSWLSIPVSSGTLSPGASVTVYIDIDGVVLGAMGEGEYEGIVEFRVDGSSDPDAERSIIVTIFDYGDRPGPANTGPYDESILVPSGSIKVTVDNTVIENVDVSGSIWVLANNVTVRNFRVNGGGGTFYPVTVESGTSGTLLEDGEILGSASAGIKGSSWIGRRLNIHESKSDGVKPHSNVTLEACWIHHLGTNDGAHADGIQMKGGFHNIFRGNYFDTPVPQPPPYKINACIIIDNSSPTGDILIEGNWLNGGAFTVMIGDHNNGNSLDGIVLRDNRWMRDFEFGPLNNEAVGAVIVGNVWDDTGELMNINNQ